MKTQDLKRYPKKLTKFKTNNYIPGEHYRNDREWDHFTMHVPVWTQVLNKFFKGKKNLKFLELGTGNGLCSNFLLDTYDCNVDTVDLQNALNGKHYEETINVTIDKDTGKKIPNEPELISMYNKVILDSSTSSASIMASREWTKNSMESGWLAKFRDYLKEVRKIPAPEVDAMTSNDLNTYFLAVSLEGIASEQNILKAQEKLKNPTN